MEYVTLKDRLNRLDEMKNKNIGKLYKFMSIKTSIMVIYMNFLMKSSIRNPMDYDMRAQQVIHYLSNLGMEYDGYCSFTRNKNYGDINRNKIIESFKTVIRFELNGNLLSKDYMILPCDFYDAQNKYNRLKMIIDKLYEDSGESEERVWIRKSDDGIVNFRKYVTNIDICNEREVINYVIDRKRSDAIISRNDLRNKRFMNDENTMSIRMDDFMYDLMIETNRKLKIVSDSEIIDIVKDFFFILTDYCNFPFER